MIRSIAFVDVNNATAVVEQGQGSVEVPDLIGINQRSHEPIGLAYVAAWAKKRGFGVDIVSPHTEAVAVKTVLRSSPGMVCFSALTYNYNVTRELARAIKRSNPNLTTVLGGYQATCAPSEASRESEQGMPLFDFVVAQEADYVAADLAEFLNGSRSHGQVRGIVYRDGKMWTNNFHRVDPNTNPVPYRTAEMMQGCRRYGLYYPAPFQQKAVALMVGSRGCPFNCKFCLSKQMFPGSGGQATFYRDPGNIITEIRDLQNRFGTNAVFFVDLDFYGLNKERIRNLSLLLGKTGMNWFGMSRVTAGSWDGASFDPEIFQLMRDGGCTQMGFGVESLVHKHKAGVKLGIPAWQELVRKLTDYLHELGILSKGYFILGDYGDTIESLAAEEAAIMDSGFDDIRLSWMMYSPESLWYNLVKERGGFITDDLSLFSTDHPIIRVPGATAEQLQQIRRDIQRRYYSRPEYASQAASMVRRFPRLAQSFKEWNGILVRSLGQGFL